MSIAIAILANKHLNRVEQLTNILSKQDVNICIHVDANTNAQSFRGLRSKFRGLQNVYFMRRIPCEWGDYSLVDAELQMCAKILEIWPDTSHVQLISGDSLPVRPMHELISTLSDNDDVDFIESVAVAENNWIAGGLGIERFTLHFPFSWKTQRQLFDLSVNLQRKLRIKRKMPDGIQPYIGSQWWCLTRETIEAILNDPMKPVYDTYFKKCWIPDESYFQTMVRKHARKIQSRSLMYSRFDHQGKPATVYDDHSSLLGGLEEFFVRKIWPGASELYQKGSKLEFTTTVDITLDSNTQRADERRKAGRPGLRMQGCAPNTWHESQRATAGPYIVFSCIDAVFTDFNGWLETKTGNSPHGRLFARQSVNFSNGTRTGPGGLSNNVKIRNASPESFLGNLVWQSRDAKLAFHLCADDCVKIETFLTRDPNAIVHHIEQGWVLDLMGEGIENQELLRSRATYLRDRERAFLSKMRDNRSRCTANICSLGDVLTNPINILSRILINLDIEGRPIPMVLPILPNIDETIAFARKLNDIGINIDMSHIETNTARGQLANRNTVNK